MNLNEYNALNNLIQSLIHDPRPTRSKLESLKRKIAKEYQLNRFVKNSEILEFIFASETLSEYEKEFLTQFLQTRRVRTISGIAVVAVMTKPSPCPGNCIYCPDVRGAPKSYTGREPAAMRGTQNKFLPKNQVEARLSQLESIGHSLDKVHLVIMGGTFLSTSEKYQEDFVKGCLDGISGVPSNDLQTAQLNVERSPRRNVGITFETRPDYCKPAHVSRMLSLGGTWVEIGVQTLSEKILGFIQRHHTLEDVVEAIRVARDGGLKVTVHMMPNLFQSPDEDLRMFKQLFSDPKFLPDALKIYPTLVLPNTKLFELWKQQEYIPYGSEDVVKVIADIKKNTPPFVRIQRVQRDIPAYLIIDGVKSGNLRELAREQLNQKGEKCSCIRCREVGHQSNLGNHSWKEKEKKIHHMVFEASQGLEHFISYETEDSETLFGFLRLREPSIYSFRPELINPNATVIRELHVYGKLVEIGKSPKGQEWQHRGLGQQLITYAEEISIKRGFNKIAVTSGLGVRDYYRKIGFVKEGVYMTKKLL